MVATESTDMSTPKTVGNEHGYLCPNCDKGTELLIAASKRISLILKQDGFAIDDESEVEWANYSHVDCLLCGWEGAVRDLLKVKMGPRAESQIGSNKREAS